MGGAGSDTIDGGFGSDVIDGGDGAGSSDIRVITRLRLRKMG